MSVACREPISASKIINIGGVILSTVKKIFVIPKELDDFIDKVVYENREEKICRSDVVIAALNLYKKQIEKKGKI